MPTLFSRLELTCWPSSMQFRGKMEGQKKAGIVRVCCVIRDSWCKNSAGNYESLRWRICRKAGENQMEHTRWFELRRVKKKNGASAGFEFRGIIGGHLSENGELRRRRPPKWSGETKRVILCGELYSLESGVLTSKWRLKRKILYIKASPIGRWRCFLSRWWSLGDSNSRPHPCEGCVLTNWTKRPENCK